MKPTGLRSRTAMPIAGSILPCSLGAGAGTKAWPRREFRKIREGAEDAQHPSPGRALACGGRVLAAAPALMGGFGQAFARKHAHRHHALYAVGRDRFRRFGA